MFDTEAQFEMFPTGFVSMQRRLVPKITPYNFPKQVIFNLFIFFFLLLLLFVLLYYNKTLQKYGQKPLDTVRHSCRCLLVWNSDITLWGITKINILKKKYTSLQLIKLVIPPKLNLSNFNMNYMVLLFFLYPLYLKWRWWW